MQMKITFKNNISSFTQQDMGSPTFLDWLHSVELSSNTQLAENIKDKDLLVRFRVLQK